LEKGFHNENAYLRKLHHSTTLALIFSKMLFPPFYDNRIGEDSLIPKTQNGPYLKSLNWDPDQHGRKRL
jgi:hypothetical protein